MNLLPYSVNFTQRGKSLFDSHCYIMFNLSPAFTERQLDATAGPKSQSGSRPELQPFTPDVESRAEWDLFSVSVYTSWKSCVYSAANSFGPSGTEGSADAGYTRSHHNPER